MNERVERLRAKMAEKELPALLVGNDDNRRYLSGFTGSAGFLLITPDKAVLLTDFRYTEQAANQAPDFVIPASQLRGDGRPMLIGAPVAGLTNQQAWLKHGVAIAGAVAPCAVKQTGFQNALVCDAAAAPAQPAR